MVKCRYKKCNIYLTNNVRKSNIDAKRPCFIDYARVFDKVKHKELLKILEDLDLFRKDIRLPRNLYWEQSACIRIRNDKSDFVKIERGVRQGCVFSPDLFNIYRGFSLRNFHNCMGSV